MSLIILMIEYDFDELICCFWQVLSSKKLLYGKNGNMTMMMPWLREMRGALLI